MDYFSSDNEKPWLFTDSLDRHAPLFKRVEWSNVWRL